MFERTLEVFDEYCEKLGSQPTFNHHLAAEVKERLCQLRYIVERVRALEERESQCQRRLQVAMSDHCKTLIEARVPASSEAAPSIVQAISDRFSAMADTALELRILTESFYYFAARVRTIARHNARPTPGLSSFECEGVRNIRNHLIEHPEGSASRVFAQSFSFDRPDGPALKTGRPAPEPDVFPDPGLYRNAEEFESNLLQSLENAIKQA